MFYDSVHSPLNSEHWKFLLILMIGWKSRTCWFWFCREWRLLLSLLTGSELKGSIIIPCGKPCLSLIQNTCPSSQLAAEHMGLCALLWIERQMRRLPSRRYRMPLKTGLMHWGLCANSSFFATFTMRMWLLWRISWCLFIGIVSRMSI